MSRRNIIIGIVVIIITIMGITRLLQKPTEETVVVKSERAVTLASVLELSQSTAPLPLIGTVTSKNEVTIKAESSGKLTSVRKKLGDHAEAGEVIAEFENSAEKAGLLQAEGAYEAASAGRDIAEINTGSSNTSLDEVKIQALNAIKNAYTSLDDAVRVKTDGAFTNPQNREAKFIPSVSDAKLVITLEEEHNNVEASLRTREEKNRTLSVTSDLVAELGNIETESNAVKNYLDDLSLALTRSIADQTASAATIEALKASTGLARTEVTGTISAIIAARNTLNASMSANAVAQKNFTGSDTGGSVTTSANIKSALGNLDAAKSRLEKTIIRSPISGTINSLSVETGDFVAPFSDIAIVSNNNALEAVVYATEEDARSLHVGSHVSIEGTSQGVITRIASALDPKTKKIEVRIGFTGARNAFINGQTVAINATRSVPSGTRSQTIQIPLSALKITPSGTVVFTVDASSTLVSHPVKEGALLGDKIVILNGLTPDMRIVTDARGLKEGTEVSVTP